MTWTNAFDVGTCTVTVDNSHSTGTPWSGVLGKGESSPPFSGPLSGETMQVSVSSSGVATLEFLSGSGPSDGYQLSVIPSYSIVEADIRVSAITMTNGISGVASAFPSTDGAFTVTLTGSASSWSPDPADIGGHLPQDGWFVFEGAAV